MIAFRFADSYVRADDVILMIHPDLPCGLGAEVPIRSGAMADPSDLNLDAPSDLQDIPEMAMQLLPPPEGTYPDK